MDSTDNEKNKHKRNKNSSEKVQEKNEKEDNLPKHTNGSESFQQPNIITIKTNIDPLLAIIQHKTHEQKSQSLKGILRRYLLIYPNLDESKYENKKYITMQQDMVLVSQTAKSSKDNVRNQQNTDFIAGSLARMFQIYVCQPFDTIKVKQQTFPHIYGNMLKCLVLTYRHYGIWGGLYAGTMAAMVSSLTENVILRAAQDGSKTAISKILDVKGTHELSVFGNACSGAVAAFFSTFVLCPAELMKCKLQTVTEMKQFVHVNGKVRTMTPVQIAKKIYRMDGNLTGNTADLLSSQNTNGEDTDKGKTSTVEDNNGESVQSEKSKSNESNKCNESNSDCSPASAIQPNIESDENFDTVISDENVNDNETKDQNLLQQKTEDVPVGTFIWDKEDLDIKKGESKFDLRRYFIKTREESKSEGAKEEHIGIENQNILKHGLKDLLAGSIAGIAQIYVSQPFDTVKVKLQTFPKLYGSMLKCFIQTYRKDGIIRGLYAGTMPAVAASICENSVLFAAYGGCQSVVASILAIDSGHELSVLGNACAGSLAACFSTLTLCPTELIKCKLQAVQEIKPYVAKDAKVRAVTPLQLTQDIYYKEGIAGFYRGLSSTFAREIPGFFFFFGSYEATREYFTNEGESKDDIGPWKTMCAGAVGGVTLWTSTFPADVIKTRIQIRNLKSSMLSVASDIIRKEGVLALYNGLMPSILRTIPATASLFVVYEYTKKILQVN